VHTANGHLGHPDVGVKILLKWMFTEIRSEVLGRIRLPQGRVQWRALVNTVMNILVSTNTGNSLTN
jgi:hypothetical protein